MQFVAVAPNQWDGQWMNRQHLMWAVKDHARVLYAQEPLPWYAGRGTRDERFFRPRIEQKSTTLSVLKLPKSLSRRTREGFWNRTVNRCKASLIRRNLERGHEPRVLYFWHPELHPYVRLLKPDLTIYHVYDRIAEYHESQFAGQPLYRAFHNSCKLADLVVVGSSQQADIVPDNQPEIVPNGVAFDWYDRQLPQPADVAEIPRPRIGYCGTISQKLDFAWFESLASRGRFHLVLIGPLGNLGAEGADDFQRLRSLSNVHYLGAKSATEVPAYIKSFDVGLMNYRRGLHCEAGSPLKLYEYAAAGLPMVAARTEFLDAQPGLADMVHFVDGPDDAVEAVERALRDERDVESIERRRAFARENSWQERARRILELAVAKLQGTAPVNLPSQTGERSGTVATHSSKLVGNETH
jgi:glycosyltransferase involved in cell wall biosynthesis